MEKKSSRSGDEVRHPPEASLVRVILDDIRSIFSDAKWFLVEILVFLRFPIPGFLREKSIDDTAGCQSAAIDEERINRNLRQEVAKHRFLDDLKNRFSERRQNREKRLAWRRQRELEARTHASSGPETISDGAEIWKEGAGDAGALLVTPDAMEAIDGSVLGEQSGELCIEVTLDAAPGPSNEAESGSYRLGDEYRIPIPEQFLMSADGDCTVVSAEAEGVARKQEILQNTLDAFAIDAMVAGATIGPRVTLFEIEPAIGVKVESVSQIANNIAMEMKASSIRVLAPIPGQRFIGIEIPNEHQASVNLRSLLQGDVWRDSKKAIPLPLGVDIKGRDVVLDLADAPHLLIAGATGSGKSVCINTILASLLFRFNPENLRLILIDPKVVEFSGYRALPHLMVPVVTESALAVIAMRWLVTEMERRYRTLSKVGVRNIRAYNARNRANDPEIDEEGVSIPDKLPFIVLVIDELADIMMTVRNEVETLLARIAQMSRAVGIHTIIATQRPSVDVVTGIIKANYPTRIAFQVSSQFDSRTILDGKGAEALLGSGDMLFKAPRSVQLQRLQGPMVPDPELEKVVEYVCSQATQRFDLAVLDASATAAVPEGSQGRSDEDAPDDPEADLLQRAIGIVVRERKASTSYLQRRLKIGYNRAASLMEELEERGVVGPQIGSNRREILVENPDEPGLFD